MSEQKNTVQFSTLEDLLSTDIETTRDQVEVELRGGKKIILPIISVDPDVEADIRKKCTRYIKDKTQRFPVVDDLKYNCLMINAATDTERTTIRWNDKKLAEKVGAMAAAPLEVIPKVLSLGGIVKAIEKISEISGLKQSFDELVEEAKN
jgi:4-hydroxy-3-methylbut-2-en-1-yl diphosphate synthase IspG/GcpE